RRARQQTLRRYLNALRACRPGAGAPSGARRAPSRASRSRLLLYQVSANATSLSSRDLFLDREESTSRMLQPQSLGASGHWPALRSRNLVEPIPAGKKAEVTL